MAQEKQADHQLAVAFENGNSEKAEWVALMCLIAERDRDLYRELRADAWDSVARSHECSKDSN